MLKKSGREWELTVSNGDADKLTHIPGLRQQQNKFYGPPDAVHVAANRLGQSVVINRPSLDTSIFPEETLYPYQREGIASLLQILKRDASAILADDMGLGKTMQALKTIQLLKASTVLVICPGSVRYTWEREIKKWLGAEALVVTDGKQAASPEIFNHQFVVTSYELSQKLNPLFCPFVVILDEAHLLRGRWAKRSRRMEEISALASYRIAITGTPMWSRPRDFWQVLRILFNKRFGTAEEFDYAYCGAQVNEYGGRENKGCTRADELKTRLSYVMVRREKKDVATQLPKVTRVVNWIDAEPNASRAFQQAMIRRNPGDTFNALRATLRSKLPRAVELALEAKRFLLFTYMKEHAEKIHQEIEAQGGKALLLTGDIPVQARSALVDRARAESMGVVATIDAAGTGVDGLQHCASTLIFHALDYVPIKIAQAIARLDRTGQTEPVTAIFLAMRESMDQRIIETIVDKLDAHKAVIGGEVDLRNALNAHEDGAGAEDYEKAALKALYESY